MQKFGMIGNNGIFREKHFTNVELKILSTIRDKNIEILSRISVMSVDWSTSRSEYHQQMIDCSWLQKSSTANIFKCNL